jgi:class 3 adenylate cyclase
VERLELFDEAVVDHDGACIGEEVDIAGDGIVVIFNSNGPDFDGWYEG